MLSMRNFIVFDDDACLNFSQITHYEVRNWQSSLGKIITWIVIKKTIFGIKGINC